MTTSWGGTSLPDPTNITLLDDFAGAQFQTIDGVLHTDERATELRFQLEWNAITYAQFGTIYTKALTNTSATIIFPLYAESPGLTVLPIRGSLSSTPVGGASEKVNVSCAVRTVT